MLCPSCGAVNRDTAKFCDECGTRLSVPDPSFLDELESRNARDARDAQEAEAVAASEQGVQSAEVNELPCADEAPLVDAAGNVEPACSDEEVSESAQTMRFDNLPGWSQEVAGGTDGQAFAEEEAGPSPDITQVISIDDYHTPESAWEVGDTVQIPRIESDGDAFSPQTRNFRAQQRSGASKRGVRIAIIVLACIAILGGALAGATYALEIWGGKSVPNVKGETYADAEYTLTNAGFKVVVKYVTSDDTEGLVLMSDPSAGQRAEKGSEIVLHIAQAREIPDIVGSSLDAAQSQLSDIGFTNVTISKKKSDKAEGTVLAVSPNTGEKAKAATEITLTVADPYRVPDVVGSDVYTAIQKVTDEGLTYDVTYSYTEDVDEGTVLAVSPDAGSAVKSGATVTLSVARSRASELVELTEEYLAVGESIVIDGTSCYVRSVSSVTYAGNDTTNFTAVVQPYTVLFGVTVVGEETSVSGSITWSSSNVPTSITSN